MKTQVRLFLTLTLTFLFAFANSECMRCKASGNNANSALRKAEATNNQQAKRNNLLGQYQLNAEYHAIELHEVFIMNGKKYHLLFDRPTDYAKGNVKNVFIYPDGFKSGSQGDLSLMLPEVKEFIVHNVPGQELWGSVIIEEIVMNREPANKKNKFNDFSMKYTSTDVRLPDDIAQKILDLIQDNSSYEWANSGRIKYSRVQTDALRKTKIGKEVHGKWVYIYTDKRAF